jgi:hypothetical protein
MVKVTWARAAAWRAGRHHLDRRAPAGSLIEVASRLCGLHAQVLSSAELTAWARVEGIQRDVVRNALWQDRTLVKTWAMRGTLHLLPSADLPLWHAALRTSKRYLSAARWARFGLTLKQLDRLTEAVAIALEGRELTREELAREVGHIMRSAAFEKKLAFSSWGTILKPAAFTGGLCFASSIGQRVRFTHPRTWLNGAAAATMDSEAAAIEISRRYLAAYGPATVHDFHRWWGGGSVATIRRWIASLDKEATQVDLEGTTAWMLAKDAQDMPAPKSVRLLPAFDHYVVAASRHAAHLLPGDFRARVFRPQGWISPVILVDGMIHGTWRHEVKGSRVHVNIEPFTSLTPRVRRAAADEIDRLSAYVQTAPKTAQLETNS